MADSEYNQDQLGGDEDLEQTIQRFVLQSPPDEENDVFNSLITIVGPDTDITHFKTAHFRQLNLEKYYVATLPGTDDKVLVTPYNELDEGHYLDPNSKQVFGFDHANRTVDDVQPLEAEDAQSEPLRKAVQDAIAPYIANNYVGATCSVFLSTQEDGGQFIAVCINATQTKPSAMWGGRWKSTWLIDLKDGKCPVKGTVEIEAHFYEAGNVSFKSSKEISGTVQLGDDENAFAKSIVSLIQKKETEFEAEIDDSFHRLNEETFKALRRKLPITKTKIDWETFALQGNIGKAH